MFGPFVYRYTFAKNTWRWKIRQQIFPQESWPTVVRCQVYPDEHACLCLCALKLCICQMQIPCVLSNFCWQSFADEVCGEESAKVICLHCPLQTDSPKFHHKLHHAPRPQTLKKIRRAATFSRPNIFMKIFVARGQCFDAMHFRAAHVPNCRFRWLQQGSCFFPTRKNGAGTSGEP